MNIPKQCYNDFGSDLDGCSTQVREGCGQCKCCKTSENISSDQVGKLDLNKMFDDVIEDGINRHKVIEHIDNMMRFACVENKEKIGKADD